MRKQRKKTRSNSRIDYRQYEARNLLASISLNNGELLIGGDSTADVSVVSQSGNEVTATLTGVESQTFSAADVNSIRFVGLGGDDQFTNETSIPSFAFGQAGNDTLIGGSARDVLVGGTGNDELTGNGGDDEIRGGAGGTKIINGNAGNDRLFGGTGTNTIRGGTGSDLIYGGDQNDTVYGDAGDDFLYPGQGNNTVYGGDGDDTVIAGRGSDEIFGEDGNDRLYGGDGPDMIRGGAGNDAVVGRTGNDMLWGGPGNDYMRGNDGDDILRGEAGNDRLQGDRGDDELNGGSNTGGGFDRILLNGVEGRYRIAGNLITHDRTGEDGLDQTSNMEWVHYITGNQTSHAAVSQIQEVVTIQPIIVSNSNGSNTAEFFGTDEEERQIKSLINNIYYQARIQVNWQTPNTWNNTFANVGNGGTRPLEDAFEIFDRGEAAGVSSNNSLIINMYFIEIVPGTGNQDENTVNGVSLAELNEDLNGVTIQVGDELPSIDVGRQAISRVTSHEIAHNMGLVHVPGNGTNLMNAPNITSSAITRAQINTLIASGFSR